MTNEYKIFSFSHGEGTEIIASNSARQAITFFFSEYMDDLNIDDIVEEGITITELTGDSITKKHFLFNEEIGRNEEVSYKEMADNDYIGCTIVLVSPHY